MFTRINEKELSVEPFRLFDKDTMLITAGDASSFNTMQASWGGMGTLWEHSVLYLFVRNSRYTHEFLQKEGLFTCSFFPKEYRKDMLYLGNHSGRKEDKVSKTRLTPVELDGCMTFKEAGMVFVCQKAAGMDIKPEAMFLQEVLDLYQNKDYSTFYIGFVKAAYKG